MNCYVNDQAVNCGAWGSVLGWVFPIPFLLIGLLCLIKPDWVVKAQVWSTKKFGMGTWKPSKWVYIFYRVFGLAFLIVGLFVLIGLHL